MIQSFRTLRFRIALLFLVIFGVIQTALCVSILVIRERERQSEFEGTLREKTDLLADSLNIPPLGVVPDSLLISASLSDCFVQISEADGRVIQQSPGLEGTALPWLGEGSFMQLHQMPAFGKRSTAGAALPLLVFGKSHALPEGSILRLQVARDTTQLNEMRAALQRITLGALVIALLVSGVAAWLAAGRSLLPIGLIARQAREFAATDLHRRLHVPEATDEVSEMARVLNQMLDRLEQAFRAQEKFIADVSHELKTPLTVLLTEAQLLGRKNSAIEDYRDFVGSVRDELERLTRTVHSLLMLTRAESGLAMQYAQPISMNELVLDAAQQCTAQAEQNRVRILSTLAVGQELHDLVAGSADLLRTALVNLIRNAIRFTPAGQPVSVVVSSSDDFVSIAVRDRGPGIAAEHLSRIFDRFYQAPGADGERLGMGLGLAIAKAMVDMHKGSIHALNLAEGGCEFRITLPRSGPRRMK